MNKPENQRFVHKLTMDDCEGIETKSGQTRITVSQYYPGHILKERILQRIEILYLGSLPDPKFNSKGLIYGSLQNFSRVNTLIFHEDYSFNKANMEFSNFLSQINSTEIDDKTGEELSFYNSYLLKICLKRCLNLLEEKHLQNIT